MAHNAANLLSHDRDLTNIDKKIWYAVKLRCCPRLFLRGAYLHVHQSKCSLLKTDREPNSDWVKSHILSTWFSLYHTLIKDLRPFGRFPEFPNHPIIP